VFVLWSSAPDPGRTNTSWQYIRVASICRSWPRGLYLDADVIMSAHMQLSGPISQHCGGCEAFTDSRCIADADPRTSHEARRLLFGVGWCVWIADTMATFCVERRRTTSVLSDTTPLLRELHWLKVLERIQFWLCVLAHRCLHDTAAPYLAESSLSSWHGATIPG